MNINKYYYTINIQIHILLYNNIQIQYYYTK